MVTRSQKWPLMIDPQSQGLGWIKKREEENKLKVTNLLDKRFRNTLEDSMAFGTPLLIENVEEEIDPVLDPVLNKDVQKKGRSMIILLSDKECDYSESFKLFLCSKLANPHFSPETFAQLTAPRRSPRRAQRPTAVSNDAHRFAPPCAGDQLHRNDGRPGAAAAWPRAAEGALRRPTPSLAHPPRRRFLFTQRARPHAPRRTSFHASARLSQERAELYLASMLCESDFKQAYGMPIVSVSIAQNMVLT